MSYSYIYALAGELGGDGCDIGGAVVIGKEHLGTDGYSCPDELFGGHGVGLVAGKEGYVDVFNG